jgi:hypothetical protein
MSDMPLDEIGSLRKWDAIRDRFLAGSLIPFLGAGASSFTEGKHPPSGRHLLEQLAAKCNVRTRWGPDERGATLYCNENCQRPNYDLARLASYYQLVRESRPTLDYELTKWIGDQTFKPNKLHRLLARIARVKPMLIITTNYDDLLERAFDTLALDEPQYGPVPYEVVATAADLLAYRETTNEPYVAPWRTADITGDTMSAGSSGILYQRFGGFSPANRSEDPHADAERDAFHEIYPDQLSVNLDTRSLIYKVHGSVPKGSNWDGGYLIAEEDYVRFLGRMDRPDIYPHAIKNVIRSKSARARGGRRRNSNALFLLGYSLNDWNMRVLMDEIGVGYGELGSERHYAVFKNADQIAVDLLEKRNFTPFDIDLDECVEELSRCLEPYLVAMEELKSPANPHCGPTPPGEY